MKKRNQLLIFFILTLSKIGLSQCDTNYLYIDYLELTLEDSKELVENLKLVNNTDTLFFEDASKIKMIGISKNKKCKMIIKTNKSEVIFDSINEYISFTETKYRISIHMPLNHTNCVEATYIRPDGLQLIHSQTMITTTLKDCVIVDSGPTGYSRFSKFETTDLLK